jgi:hypothetical protein
MQQKQQVKKTHSPTQLTHSITRPAHSHSLTLANSLIKSLSEPTHSPDQLIHRTNSFTGPTHSPDQLTHRTNSFTRTESQTNRRVQLTCAGENIAVNMESK